MKTNIVMAIALAGLVATGAAGATAFAANQVEEPDATALKGAKVSLAQAIAIAEQKTGGQAYDAGVDGGGGQARIVVETNGPTGMQSVSVDPQTGLVVASKVGARDVEEGGADQDGNDGESGSK